MSLAAEREASATRLWRARVERIARGTLYHLGGKAGLKSVERYIRETWPALEDGQVEEVLARAGTMREEGIQTARHLAPEEIEMAVTKATRETREAITALLRQDPTMTSEELWLRCQSRRVTLTAKSSFAGHCSWARKELGIDGRAAAERGRAKGREVQASRVEKAGAGAAPRETRASESQEEPAGVPLSEPGGPPPPSRPTSSVPPAEASTGDLAAFRQTLVEQLAALDRQASELRAGIALVDRYGS